VEYRDYDPIQPQGTNWRGILRKIFTPVIVLFGLALKFGFFAFKFFGIFISVGAYALIWGWRFAVGFVVLIFVHEMGHYVEAAREGLHPQWPRFIPLIGAYVKHLRGDAWQTARVAIAGPFVGGLGAAAFWGIGEAQDSNLMRALGYSGFLLNGINLLPVGILDGGAISKAWRQLRSEDQRGRAFAVGVMYVGTLALLVAGAYYSHVQQNRL